MKRIRTFRAHDGNRRIYVIEEWADDRSIGTLEDSHATFRGLPEFHLIGGGRVNKRSDTEFQIVDTGELLTALPD